MSNMGYCQFRNTLQDLRDCRSWLDDNEPGKLEGEELQAFERLIKLCAILVRDYGGDSGK